MRYHRFKSSSAENLLIAVSQARDLEFSNFNILSLPGAVIKHVDNFLPPKNKYDLIALFIGDSVLLNGEHSLKEPKEVADLLIISAFSLKSLCKRCYSIGISIRGDSIHNKRQVRAINKFIEKKIKGTGLQYRRVCHKIYCEYLLCNVLVHIAKELSGSLC